MKIFSMILLIILIFAGGCWISKGIDSFIRKTCRLPMSDEHPRYRWIHIAVENTAPLNTVAEILENCSDTVPYLRFLVEQKDQNQIFSDLRERRLDIAVLETAPKEHLLKEYQIMQIPHKISTHTLTADTMIEPSKDSSKLFLVWAFEVDPHDIDYIRNMLEHDFDYD